ncbi:DMT family transporter [Methylomarinum vadi]|uniref:DMT family transporter n=1 Tax=Methylomarinum vadi TaxID=438855 RepID=UPI000AE5C6B8|nr:DMT family transporter [Methylomarinum vadi]
MNNIRILLSYLCVTLLWATTPLAIKWSAEGAGFIAGAALRMAIGTLCVFLMLIFSRQRLPWHRFALLTYLGVAVQIFGAMMAVYWSSRFIPSGWVSVIFGLTPFMTALLAAFFQQEQSLGWGKLFSYLLGIGGLALMFSSAIDLNVAAIQGMCGVLFGAFLHSLSAVWIKQIDAKLPAMVQVGGGLLLAMPLYLGSWYVYDDVQLPSDMTLRSLIAIVYLGVIATSVGFALYYFVLTHLPATTVALITIIAPVLALLLGFAVNDEELTAKVAAGASLILTALLVHQFVERRRRKEQLRSV